jgi:predicted nucleic acid-binding Zn ribbon protein
MPGNRLTQVVMFLVAALIVITLVLSAIALPMVY